MSSAQGEGVARRSPVGSPEGSPGDLPAVSPRVRALVSTVWALLLVHFVATFLWAAPTQWTGRPDDDSSADTPATGVDLAVQTYMNPVFAQNWSIFAPSPLHVEYALRVRGVYADGTDGVLVPGPWIDTTAVEVRALTGHILPAATERPSRRLASETRTAYLALPEAGRAIVLRSPLSAPDQPAAASDPWPTLRTVLLDEGVAPAVVDDYLVNDRALVAYATQVLRADAGAAGVPVFVQVSIVRHEVTPYGTGERPAPTELTLGARPPEVVPGQDDAAFRTTWDALQRTTPATGGGAG
ncbi:DUF5819 family protein [Promicromonospora sp. Populi]|uniref:DUF5819 family protein n=1 Tax=Promicromonospora sp. Populi TaxID=3239420 RepID=UPI0034E2ECF3